MTLLKRYFNLLIFGGSRKLNHMEQRLLNIGKDAMPSHYKEVFAEQIKLIQRIKRYNNNRMITFQFDGEKPPLFDNQALELSIVSFNIQQRKNLRKDKYLGAIISHRGMISSLEIRIPLTELSDGDWSVVSAIFLGQQQKLSEAIDNEEHEG